MEEENKDYNRVAYTIIVFCFWVDETFYTILPIKLLPVISGGVSSPSNSKTVGAISESVPATSLYFRPIASPPSGSGDLKSCPIKKNGTGLRGWLVLFCRPTFPAPAHNVRQAAMAPKFYLHRQKKFPRRRLRNK